MVFNIILLAKISKGYKGIKESAGKIISRKAENYSWGLFIN
jgi:hypothetical protein